MAQMSSEWTDEIASLAPLLRLRAALEDAMQLLSEPESARHGATFGGMTAFGPPPPSRQAFAELLPCRGLDAGRQEMRDGGAGY